MSDESFVAGMSAHLAQDPANGARLLEDPVRMRAVAADLAASDPPLRNALVALVDLRIARSFLGDSAPSSGIRAHVAARLVDEQGIRSDVAARVVALLAEAYHGSAQVPEAPGNPVIDGKEAAAEKQPETGYAESIDRPADTLETPRVPTPVGDLCPPDRAQWIAAGQEPNPRWQGSSQASHGDAAAAESQTAARSPAAERLAKEDPSSPAKGFSRRRLRVIALIVAAAVLVSLSAWGAHYAATADDRARARALAAIRHAGLVTARATMPAGTENCREDRRTTAGLDPNGAICIWVPAGGGPSVIVTRHKVRKQAAVVADFQSDGTVGNCLTSPVGGNVVHLSTGLARCDADLGEFSHIAWIDTTNHMVTTISADKYRLALIAWAHFTPRMVFALTSRNIPPSLTGCKQPSVSTDGSYLIAWRCSTIEKTVHTTFAVTGSARNATTYSATVRPTGDFPRDSCPPKGDFASGAAGHYIPWTFSKISRGNLWCFVKDNRPTYVWNDDRFGITYTSWDESTLALSSRWAQLDRAWNDLTWPT